MEPETGVFLGNPSARVRDELWKLALAKAGQGSVVQVWSHPCPQGYRFRAHNTSSREFVDCEGLALVRVRAKQAGAGAKSEANEAAAEAALEGDGQNDAAAKGSLTTE